MLSRCICDLLKVIFRAVDAFGFHFTFLLLAFYDLIEPNRRSTSKVYCDDRVSDVRDGVIGPS
jgi:hypothetical protein